ncbi:alkyl sulfatase C-terminal domain-containing protein [Nocardia sp. NPDC050697]|uniref:alkyl/aryl-sulfatase n=1 Tax=Nocardia sp. NPDC050697 TaxID=3155158 RepID=UPI0033C350C3
MATTEQVETDFADADRGFVGTDDAPITGADGRVVFHPGAYDFLAAEPPAQVHPGLWRQSRLNAEHGLYEVTAGIYQVRGFDISTMTLIEGATGVIVVDPLTAAETAAAALALYRRHRGDRPVTAVIYTHPHADHFGGVLGVVQPGTRVPIVAPEHFLEHAVSENVYAGVATLRRGYYYGGDPLPLAADGKVGIGLGVCPAHGSIGLLAPTVEISATGEAATYDGVEFVFQMTPGTEAPAEMNFHLPGHRALCMAENTAHNLLTLRGAQVRDPRIRSRYIAEATELFGGESDVLFASHHWPTWGRARIAEYLRAQRDLYAYLHDQSVRLMNQGCTGAEIAERITLPESLAANQHVRGYYGSVSHNVKAVFQRYLGWYDGNPAQLRQHPPVERARNGVTAPALSSAGMAGALTVTQLFDTVAIRLVPERAGDQRLSIHWVLTDLAEHYRMELGNAVLVHFPTRRDDAADLTVELTHPQLLAALTTGDLGAVRCTGDPGVLRRILAMTDAPDPRFAVVTP